MRCTLEFCSNDASAGKHGLCDSCYTRAVSLLEDGIRIGKIGSMDQGWLFLETLGLAMPIEHKDRIVYTWDSAAPCSA